MTNSIIASPTAASIRRAAELLRAGQLVGVPTETVYGLAADATNPSAVAKIYAAKRRPASNPLILHVASAELAHRWIHVRRIDWLSKQFDIASQFWPGPLTVVGPAAPEIVGAATADGDTVGIRVPNHPVALRLLQQCDFPLAAPSANPSNYISPTTAGHVAIGLGDQVSMILDGGPCDEGLESTIIELDQSGPRLLRPGAVPVSELEAALGHSIALPSHSDSSNERVAESGQPMTSPGQFAKHYSPSTRLVIAGDIDLPVDCSRVGRILFAAMDQEQNERFGRVWTLSQDGNLNQVAQRLFATLRQADECGLDCILIDRCETTGIGLAIMDRINRAASPNQ